MGILLMMYVPRFIGPRNRVINIPPAGNAQYNGRDALLVYIRHCLRDNAGQTPASRVPTYRRSSILNHL
jgi:hypothetical protein